MEEIGFYVPVWYGYVGKYLSEGDVKQDDDSLSVVGVTENRTFKQYDDGMFVVGHTYCDMSYDEAVSKR